MDNERVVLRMVRGSKHLWSVSRSVSAADREGNIWKVFKGFCLKAKVRIWP